MGGRKGAKRDRFRVRSGGGGGLELPLWLSLLAGHTYPSDPP